MILVVDVAYVEAEGVAAGVLLKGWSDISPSREIVVRVPRVEEYVPGEFFRRELPCIEAVLEQVDEPLECVVVDGYVTLGEPPRDGLGAALWAVCVRQPRRRAMDDHCILYRLRNGL